MSSPQPSSAEQHQQAQTALNGAALAALASAWVLLDVTRMAATLPAFTAAVRAVVVKYGQAAASAALIHYRRQRAAVGVTAPFRPRMPPAPPEARIEAEVQWATRDLWRAPAGQTSTFVPDVPAAQQQLEAAVQKLVADQGRAAVLDAVKSDPKAKGWARVPHPDESLSGTCAFCLLLATRGAVYKSQATAKFQAHTGCNCTAEPQFSSRYEPTATVRAAQKLYRDSTGHVSGMNAKQIAFRRAVEGRKAPEVAPTPAAPARPKMSPKSAQALADRLEQSIAKMRANNKNGSLDRTIHATEQRLAALRDELVAA